MLGLSYCELAFWPLAISLTIIVVYSLCDFTSQLQLFDTTKLIKVVSFSFIICVVCVSDCVFVII